WFYCVIRCPSTATALPYTTLFRSVCRDCGTEEVWPAERQKWWYEVAKGNIFTDAVFCRRCREAKKAQKAEARRRSEAGLARKRRSEEHTSELQSRENIVCRLLLEK